MHGPANHSEGLHAEDPHKDGKYDDPNSDNVLESLGRHPNMLAQSAYNSIRALSSLKFVRRTDR